MPSIHAPANAGAADVWAQPGRLAIKATGTFLPVGALHTDNILDPADIGRPTTPASNYGRTWVRVGAIPAAHSSLGWSFLFTGRAWDADIRQYYYRYRWYDPHQCRWTALDPTGYVGGIEQYAYCAWNPVNFVDPLGLAPAHQLGGGGGGGRRSPLDGFFEGAGMGAHTALNSLSFGLTDRLGWTGDANLRYAGQGFTRGMSELSRDLLVAAGTAGAGGAATATTAGTGRQFMMSFANAAGKTYLLGQDARAIGDGVGMIRAGRPIRGLVSAVGGMAGVRGGIADDVARIGNAGRGAADVAGAPTGRTPTIGGRTPINCKYAGKTPPSGIPFTEQGFPDFSRVAKVLARLKDLTGDRASDDALANLAVGLKGTPKGYTWHHVEDGATMQLVPTQIHRSVGHTGGAAVIKNGGFDP